MKQLIVIIFTLGMMIGSLSAQVTSYPFNEGFENETFPPFGWSLLGGDISGGNWGREMYQQISGNGSAMSINCAMFGGLLNPDNYLVSPAFELPTDYAAVLKWKASRAGANQTYSILVSTSTPTIDDFVSVWTGSSTMQSPAYHEEEINLSEFAGETVYIAIRHHDSPDFPMFGNSMLLIDDFEVSMLFDYDLSAQFITGPTITSSETEVEFTVGVANLGAQIASNYLVNLVSRDAFGDTNIGSLPGVSLASGEVYSYIFAWTPTIPGNYQLFGWIDYALDEAISNNHTNLHDFMVSPFAYTSIYVGNPSSGFSPQGPFQMNQQSTLMQTIYNESDIVVPAGLLTHITYRFRGYGDITEGIVYRMYIATTTQDDFDGFVDGTGAPWIPFYHFDLVYEGELSLQEAGVRDIDIIFDTPFNYEGGNIVVMTQRGEADWEPNFHYDNGWQTTLSAANTNSLSYGGWMLANPESPGNLYTSGTNITPNITFHFLNGDSGTLEGQVTHNGVPLSEVEILQNGTPRRVYTDEDGYYSLAYVPEGFLSITASKFMYVPQLIDDIVIESGSITIRNIEMEIISYDLRATTLEGPIMPSELQAVNYRISVINNGSATAEGYEVLLKQVVSGGNDIVLNSVLGEALASTMSQTYTLSWTPPSQEPVELYGQIIFASNPTNDYDTTNSLLIFPQPFGSPVAYIGDPTSTHYQNNPHIAFNMPTSISQMIYREDEIGFYGPITQISYKFRGMGDIPEPAWVQFYATLTEMNEFPLSPSNPFLSDAWIPYNEMTLIFDGFIDVTGIGERDIVIDLIEAFNYTGGNLLIATYAPMDFARWYQIENGWQQTTFVGQNKAIRGIDYVHYNFDNLAPGFITEYIPNTAFKFATAGMGGIYGLVLHGTSPIYPAEITIEGTQIKRLTDSDGNYYIPYLPVGPITINVTAFGFFDMTRNTTIIEDDFIMESFEMIPRPHVSINGSIISSETNNGLEGVTIILNGYQNYETTTNEIGQFTLSVFADEIYTLTISKEEYITHTELIEIGNTDITLPPVTLVERPLRPRNVQAVSTDNLVLLSWNSPLAENKTISQSSQDIIFDGIGTGGVSTFTVAHRFTEAQLSALGVQHGDLTGLSIVISERYATFRIKAWAGGSASPLNSGNLIYQGDAIHGSNLTMYAWNDINFLAPITIPATGELWIGYEVVSQTGFPAGVDEGPGNNMYGNLLFIDEWSTLAEDNPTLSDYNFMIRGYVTSAEGDMNILTMSGDSIIEENIVSSLTRELKSWEKANKISLMRRSEGQINYLRSMLIDFPSFILKERNERGLLNYDVFRAPLESMYDETAWILLSSAQTENSYTDDSWAEIPTGEFRYIVRARYSGDYLSNPAFSNIVYKNMESTFDLMIYTHDGGPVNGAIVRLVNNDGNPNHIYQQIATQNRVIFPMIWHGIYTLSLDLDGYQRIERRDLNVYDDFDFAVFLQSSSLLYSENFDTEVFPPAGWTLLDADGDGHNWLHLTTFQDQAHTPPYFAVSFTNNGVEILRPDNYLIMQNMALPDNSDINLKYHIVTASEAFPTETYSVMIDYTNPPGNNFTTLFTETLTEANITWQERNIDLSEYSGQYVLIAFRHHNSYNNNAIGLDTIEITYGDRIVNDQDKIEVPIKTALRGNYPNPFNPSTTISFDVAKAGEVQLDIYNIKGQKVINLLKEHREIGNHKIEWNGTDENGKNVSSGIYFYRMKTIDSSELKRMVLIK